MSTTVAKKRCLLVSLVVCLALTASGCQFGSDVPPLLDTIQIIPGTAEVTRDDVYQLQTVQASVVPETEELAFQIGGDLSEVYYDAGDAVKKGEAIMKLDDSDLVEKIETLEEEIASVQDENARTNRKTEIKIEIARLQLSKLEKELASIPEKEDPPEESQPEESKPEESQPEESQPEESEPESSESGESSSSEESLPSSEPNSSQEELEPQNLAVFQTTAQNTATDADAEANEQKRNDLQYDIQLKKLEIENYQLTLSQNQESQEAALAGKQKLLDEYKEEQESYTLYAPSDGTILWMCPAADPLQQASPKINAETTVVLFANNSKLQLESERISPAMLASYERIYAIIDGKEYDVVPLENDVQEDSIRAMEGKSLKTRYELKDKKAHAQAGMAVLCFKYNVAEDVLTVPTGCTFYDTGYFVYKMNGSEREKVYVELGQTGAVRVEIRSGLQEGDLIYAKP